MISALALVAVLVVVLAVANWGTVRDHVEAWRFQMTRKTRTIEPIAGRGGSYRTLDEYVLHLAADQLSRPVIFDPQGISPQRPMSVSGDLREVLANRGYRVLEQRLPRRAFVVIRDADHEQDIEIQTQRP